MRIFSLSLLLLSACRPTLGPPDYPAFGVWTETGDAFLVGPDPYEPGEERLAVGIFYEGEVSELVIVDDVSTHYYIYDGYTQLVSSDRVEGLESARLVQGLNPWWGGGVHWDSPVDLSAWTVYHLSFKSSDSALSTFDIGMTGGGTEGLIAAGDYGWVADGEWHHLAIPTSDFAANGTDLSSVEVALLLLGETTADGAEILVDNVYLTKE